MIRINLLPAWHAKEEKEGRRITLTEISEATGLTQETIRYLRDGKTKRFDAVVLSTLCKYFEVPSGQCVPFLEFIED